MHGASGHTAGCLHFVKWEYHGKGYAALYLVAYATSKAALEVSVNGAGYCLCICMAKESTYSVAFATTCQVDVAQCVLERCFLVFTDHETHHFFPIVHQPCNPGIMQPLYRLLYHYNLSLGAQVFQHPFIQELLNQAAPGNHYEKVSGYSEEEVLPFRQAADYIDQHPLTEPLTIAEICQHVFMNKSRLFVGFIWLFGTRPRQYLIERRMKEASVLLATSQELVISIAYQVGYKKHGAFSFLFLRRFGMSPKRWRKVHLRGG